LDVKVGYFNTGDNLGLYYNCWPARDDAPCAVYLHGLESHMGWFFNMAEYLNSKGINVYAFDRRGSGLNKESCKRFCCDSLSSDIKMFVDLVRGEHPESKIFLIGLCLGGKLAVSFLNSNPSAVDGLILVSPSLKSRLRFSLKDIFSILFKPDSMVKVPIEDGMFTSNEKFLNHIKNDPMRLHYIPACHLREIKKMDKAVGEASRSLRLPVLLMLAGIDIVIDTAFAKRWYGKLPSSDKTLSVYKDFYHILTFEKDPEKVMKEMSDWIWARSND
jgi:alpha-beta hydrolase superfamily lysophospholipase